MMGNPISTNNWGSVDMKKERYVRLISGRYYWRPTPEMKAAGFFDEGLGADLAAANARAAVLNAAWDAERDGTASAAINKIEAGTFNALFAAFQKDATWYRSRAIRTREGIDRAFRRLAPIIGSARVAAFKARHGRAAYNKLRQDGGIHVARDTMKWLRRAMRYSVEIGMRDDNPLIEMSMEEAPPRQARWTPEEVEAVIDAALVGGKADSGNIIPPRPSVALATAIAYDIGQQRCDVLKLLWNQWDGEAFTVVQQKKRGNRTLYLPVSDRTREMIEASERTSPYVIVCEQTGQPFVDPPDTSARSRQTAFARLFKKFRVRAGVTRNVWFADLRRTALSEYGNSGATETEIVSISGHRHGSQILNTYVVPDRAAALAAAQKRWRK